MESAPFRRVVGTAGHIDHGKTALVRAITGIDCDRLPEEKRRGITIDLGFAHWKTSGAQIAFVDVPGHERFVRNMLAGVGGIDCALLVVAADESVMPQTREHLAICRLLRIPTGLVAITKSDLADPDLLGTVRLEVQELVRDTFLDGQPIIAVSATTGEGIETLKDEILRVAREAPERDPAGHVFRLPIDRAFTVKGFGSVVTGTTISGSLEVDSEVELLPEGLRTRARNIQVHGESRDTAVAGERTSVNLADIPLSGLRRGQQLVEPDALAASQIVTIAVELLPDAPPLEDATRVRFHLHSAERLGGLHFMGEREGPLRPGERAYAQIRLEAPVVAVAGDRFVIRRYSPAVTIGGGSVLDAHLSKLRRSTPREILEDLDGTPLPIRLERLAALAGLQGLTISRIRLHAGLSLPAVLEVTAQTASRLVAVGDGPERRWLHPDAVTRFRRDATAFLDSWFRQNRLSVGVPRGTFVQKLLPEADPSVVAYLLSRLADEGMLAVSADVIDLPGRSKQLSGTEGELSRAIEKTFAEAGLAPPLVSELIRTVGHKAKIVEGVLGYLVKTGRLVRIADGIFIHADVLREVRERLAPHRGETVGVAWFKEFYGISRKIVIPLLECFDARGVTKRAGDVRTIL